MSGFDLLLVGWVAYTSINVIVQDRVITTEHRRLRQVQMLYDARNAAIDDFEFSKMPWRPLSSVMKKWYPPCVRCTPPRRKFYTCGGCKLEEYRLDNRSGEAIIAKNHWAAELRQPRAAAGAGELSRKPAARRASGPKFRGTQPGAVQPRDESFLHNVVQPLC
jgi:hypothetical protein